MMLLELEHVSKEYEAPDGRKIQILRDISVAVDASESLAIVGPSGSGKSTLLNIMGTLDCPTCGSVRLGGDDLSKLSREQLAGIRNGRIGFVFQLHHLLPQCSVIENVLVPTIPRRGDRRESHERAGRLLERVGLGGRIHHRPTQLSGGECQRVAVVRALINKPGLILADEPTGSLDHAAAVEIGRLLVEINAEERTALVVVTHSAELASRMKRKMTLRDGRLE